MKSVLTILSIITNEDINEIKEVISVNEGIIACEININKKEVSIVYDDRTVSLEKIIIAIEELGYSVK